MVCFHELDIVIHELEVEEFTELIRHPHHLLLYFKYRLDDFRQIIGRVGLGDADALAGAAEFEDQLAHLNIINSKYSKGSYLISHFHP